MFLNKKTAVAKTGADSWFVKALPCPQDLQLVAHRHHIGLVAHDLRLSHTMVAGFFWVTELLGISGNLHFGITDGYPLVI